eukprot:scaffold70896_cov65-Phaeocystis_antarctica.AAC.1
MQSARAASTPAGVGLMGAPRLASWPRPGQRHAVYLASRELRNASHKNLTKKGVYGGLHFKSRALTNYLRRRSPGPPFPPDHRQAGERGAKSVTNYCKLTNVTALLRSLCCSLASCN